MKLTITERKLKGVFEVDVHPFVDERGFFARVYDEKIFQDAGLPTRWVQENHSQSLQKGILRGLHFLLNPDTDGKLVRCTRGEIYDVIVDLRKGSETFGQWDSLILSEENKKELYIPKGFAHGFLTLCENSEVQYKHDSFYKPTSDSGMLWDDPDLNIHWPIENPILSLKDSKLMSFADFVKNHGFL